jgi:hypothetical protein
MLVLVWPILVALVYLVKYDPVLWAWSGGRGGGGEGKRRPHGTVGEQRKGRRLM